MHGIGNSGDDTNKNVSGGTKTSVEKTARTGRRVRYVQQAVLGAIAVSGILLVGMAAPNTLQLLKYLPGMKKYRFNYQVKTALSRLKTKGHIVFVERRGKKYARLTPEGERALALERHKAALLNGRKRRWDKRWRVVIFDIPERRKQVRERLRLLMRASGFALLQNSVWVYPHDCEDLITLAKAELRLGGSVLYLVVESIENEKHLRDHFGLPRMS